MTEKALLMELIESMKREFKAMLRKADYWAEQAWMMDNKIKSHQTQLENMDTKAGTQPNTMEAKNKLRRMRSTYDAIIRIMRGNESLSKENDAKMQHVIGDLQASMMVLEVEIKNAESKQSDDPRPKMTNGTKGYFIGIAKVYEDRFTLERQDVNLFNNYGWFETKEDAEEVMRYQTAWRAMWMKRKQLGAGDCEPYVEVDGKINTVYHGERRYAALAFSNKGTAIKAAEWLKTLKFDDGVTFFDVYFGLQK